MAGLPLHNGEPADGGPGASHVVAYHMRQDPRGLWYLAEERGDGSLALALHQGSEHEADTESNRKAAELGVPRYRQSHSDDIPYPHGGYHPDAAPPEMLARGVIELPVNYPAGR